MSLKTRVEKIDLELSSFIPMTENITVVSQCKSIYHGNCLIKEEITSHWSCTELESNSNSNSWWSTVLLQHLKLLTWSSTWNLWATYIGTKFPVTYSRWVALNSNCFVKKFSHCVTRGENSILTNHPTKTTAHAGNLWSRNLPIIVPLFQRSGDVH